MLYHKILLFFICYAFFFHYKIKRIKYDILIELITLHLSFVPFILSLFYDLKKGQGKNINHFWKDNVIIIVPLKMTLCLYHKAVNMK